MESIADKQKPIAFEIDIKGEAAKYTTPKKSTNLQQRLESRKNRLLSSEDKLTIDSVEEKLERAKEKREQRMLAFKDSSKKKAATHEELVVKFEHEVESLKRQLERDLALHEERRLEFLSKRQQKAQIDLDKVKFVQAKVASKEMGGTETNPEENLEQAQ